MKPPVFLETPSSNTLPTLSLTTSPDLLIFTDLAVTTSTKVETTELDSTNPTLERTSTSESANTPWDPSLTELLTTDSSRPPDLPSPYSLTTSVLPSVLLSCRTQPCFLDSYPRLHR